MPVFSRSRLSAALMALTVPFVAPNQIDARAQSPAASAPMADKMASVEKEKAEPRRFVSEHALILGDEEIAFTAIAGETFIKNAKGDDIASIFSTSYIAKGHDDPRTRPVAFVFNGGPGSASLWLHMGVFGPKRLQLPVDEDGNPLDDGAPPYDMQENPYSALDVADLVFVDPVGTGFSKALGDEDPEQFWGVTADAKSLREFIRLWLTEHRRWNSPKYLMGESYGTTRIAALVNELEGGLTDIAINGAVLISVVLNFNLDDTVPGNAAGYAGLLPTYAATAWYHDQIDRARWDNDLEKFLGEVREFAIDDYVPGLMRGRDLPSDQRDSMANALSGYIGLDPDYLVRSHLTVRLQPFMRELLRDQGISVGRLDSRFTGVEADGVGQNPEFDPSFYGIDAGYTAAMLDYFTRDLAVDMIDPYTTIGGVRNWDWATREAGGSRSFLNVAPYLERAMRQNKDLRILAANGYYDHATPFFATELTFNQPGFDADRVSLTYYEAGHMMYIHGPSLEKLAEDVRQFIRDGE
ncbi:MAG: peptidase S10 [Pseudomonadota bacterium]